MSIVKFGSSGFGNDKAGWINRFGFLRRGFGRLGGLLGRLTLSVRSTRSKRKLRTNWSLGHLLSPGEEAPKVELHRENPRGDGGVQ